MPDQYPPRTHTHIYIRVTSWNVRTFLDHDLNIGNDSDRFRTTALVAADLQRPGVEDAALKQVP